MVTETIKREDEFNRDEHSHIDVIQGVEDEIRSRYEVRDILSARVACDSNREVWWVSIEAEVDAE